MIATHQFDVLADKTLGGDVDDVGHRLTGSTVGCRPTASSCYVSVFLSFKINRIDLGKSGCSKLIR